MHIKIPALLQGRHGRQMATDADGQSTNDSDHKATIDSKHERIELENGVQHFESATDTQGRVTGRVILAISALRLTYEAALFSFVVRAAVLLTINADVGPSANLSWVASSWSLANAVLQATFGRGADIFGRRYFLICGDIFGLVWNFSQRTHKLIQAQGIGAALQQVTYVSAFEIVPKETSRGANLSALNLAALPASMFGDIIVIQTLSTTEPDRAGWLRFVLNAAGTIGIMTSGIFFGILKPTRLQLVAYTALQTVFPAAMSTITQHSLARAVVLAILTGWALSSTMSASVLFVQCGAGDDRLGISNGLRGTIVNSGAAIGFAIYGSIVNNKVRGTMGPTMATAFVGAGLPANSIEPFISAAFIGSLFVPSVDIHLTQHTAVQLDKPHVIGHGEGEAKVLTEESA
ncbi:hypothetical protein Z517_12454 [Fonsecaea pedrosoi CBS 271.37]|uniref:Unplaced genomic scaffold supercont1.9, whole genome shotgun sequence n=1 Tax=Fonsecaea pedrosoi CBS 271.37 TaxID=1442368 RepID=A0A0D2GQ74_9EURO|nr:uncharacterized protein Z517_12454 [Fonsecaea pedrosoi CBS 271.37]KIW74514.1 hypothetical protein Z517_12454 [Fonsecaea pedrosoi CBS 271.37]